MEWPKPLQHIPAISQCRHPTTSLLPRNPPSLPTLTLSHYMSLLFSEVHFQFPFCSLPKENTRKDTYISSCCCCFSIGKKK